MGEGAGGVAAYWELVFAGAGAGAGKIGAVASPRKVRARLVGSVTGTRKFRGAQLLATGAGTCHIGPELLVFVGSVTGARKIGGAVGVLGSGSQLLVVSSGQIGAGLLVLVGSVTGVGDTGAQLLRDASSGWERRNRSMRLDTRVLMGPVGVLTGRIVCLVSGNLERLLRWIRARDDAGITDGRTLLRAHGGAERTVGVSGVVAHAVLVEVASQGLLEHGRGGGSRLSAAGSVSGARAAGVCGVAEARGFGGGGGAAERVGLGVLGGGVGGRGGRSGAV